MPQKSSARRRIKKRRTRRLAQWRETQAQKKADKKPAADRTPK